MLRCSCCGRDIDAIYQDNLSDTPNKPLCEDCSGYSQNSIYDHDSIYDIEFTNRRFLSKKQFKFLMKYAGWSYFRVKNSQYSTAVKKISEIVYMMNVNKKNNTTI